MVQNYWESKITIEPAFRFRPIFSFWIRNYPTLSRTHEVLSKTNIWYSNRRTFHTITVKLTARSSERYSSPLNPVSTSFLDPRLRKHLLRIVTIKWNWVSLSWVTGDGQEERLFKSLKRLRKCSQIWSSTEVFRQHPHTCLYTSQVLECAERGRVIEPFSPPLTILRKTSRAFNQCIGRHRNLKINKHRNSREPARWSRTQVPQSIGKTLSWHLQLIKS